MSDDRDGYDMEIPDEIRPWLESQRKKYKDDGYWVLTNGKLKPASLEEWGK